ncbi:transposase [Salinisphaera sp. PC39]|uniref:transposase n=1 Tax=Salinisphaera sp. PC39 TaxID=1304156 RepID=UPI00333EFD6C
MPRLARVVLPGVPHHVTQRGNRREPVFFRDEDYTRYLHWVGQYARKAGTEVLAYCLMPNHVHLILVPQDEDGLRACVSEAHRRYTQHVNQREDWTGHLWQGRFHSFPMEESHLLQAMRYVELNPVQGGLVSDPADWPWSSARAHLTGRDDPLVDPASARELVDDWAGYLAERLPERIALDLERHMRTGRPLGTEDFIKDAERRLGRKLQRRKPGPKPKAREK